MPDKTEKHGEKQIKIEKQARGKQFRDLEAEAAHVVENWFYAFQITKMT